MFWTFLGIGSLFLYLKFKPYKASSHHKHELLTNMEQGISLRSEKNKGRLFSQSGHPDENINDRHYSSDLSSIQKKASNKIEAAMFALTGGHFNKNAIFDRTAFKNPSDELHQPMPDVRSHWYQNARHNTKPMLSRVIPTY